MSNWTHVVATVRIDGFMDPKYVTKKHWAKEIFGYPCLFDSPKKTWNDRKVHPEKYLPMGSEGSLNITSMKYKECGYTEYVVTIFGDLRDHEDPKAIIDWFKSKLKLVWIRQATIRVDNEFNGSLSWCCDWNANEEIDD